MMSQHCLTNIRFRSWVSILLCRSIKLTYNLLILAHNINSLDVDPLDLNLKNIIIKIHAYIQTLFLNVLKPIVVFICVTYTPTQIYFQ